MGKGGGDLTGGRTSRATGPSTDIPQVRDKVRQSTSVPSRILRIYCRGVNGDQQTMTGNPGGGMQGSLKSKVRRIETLILDVTVEFLPLACGRWRGERS